MADVNFKSTSTMAHMDGVQPNRGIPGIPSITQSSFNYDDYGLKQPEGDNRGSTMTKKESSMTGLYGFYVDYIYIYMYGLPPGNLLHSY